MLFARLFARRDSRSPSRSLGHTPRPAAERRRTQRPPHVEVLEDRTLLSGWVVDAVGTLDDPFGRQIAVDSSGNSYVTGPFDGTVDFDPGAGVANLTSVGSTDIFVAKYSPTGALGWARRAGSTGSDRANALATDGAGNIYVVGRFSGVADFGSFTATSAGNLDIFLAKLDAVGNFLWVRTAGGTLADSANDVAVDASGSVYVTGQFSGPVDFNPDPNATETLTSTGDFDVFAWKLSGDGNLVWARRAGSIRGDRGHGIALDVSGNSYITGSFEGTADFGSVTLVNSGGSDAFVAKLDSSGAFVWSRGIARPLDSACCSSGMYPGIAAGGSGNVYVNGDFVGTADFGGVTLTSVNDASGAATDDVFVAKLDATSGNLVWVRQLGGPGHEHAGRLVIDASGNVYAVGKFPIAGLDFDPSSAAAYLTTTGLDDGFVWKLDGSGNFVWARRMGGDIGNDRTAGVALDTTGRVITTGGFFGGSYADFDGGSSVSTLNLRDNLEHMFVAATDQVVPTTPQLARLKDSPDPILNGGGTLTLTADVIRIVAGGSNVASVSFYRDKNGNGLLDVGTDTLLGTDSDGSNGWSLSLAVSLPKGQQQVTYTYFAQAKDSANVSGNVVSTTNTIKKGRIAAMVTSRDVRQRGVDAVIASHYFNHDDRENNLTLLERLDRHTLRDLLRARRLR